MRRASSTQQLLCTPHKFADLNHVNALHAIRLMSPSPPRLCALLWLGGTTRATILQTNKRRMWSSNAPGRVSVSVYLNSFVRFLLLLLRLCDFLASVSVCRPPTQTSAASNRYWRALTSSKHNYFIKIYFLVILLCFGQTSADMPVAEAEPWRM